jgi:putative ABC transport system permease protein
MNAAWVFRMAWRDSRRNRSRLLLFMGSISAGIAALVAIYSFGDDLKRNVNEQAATLIGADLRVSTNKLPSGTAKFLLDSLHKDAARSEEQQFGSMVYFPRTGGTRLTQIRALEGAYPYYGTLETTPVSSAGTFQRDHAALLDKALMLQYNVRVGDSVQVGNHTFLIEGSLEKAPGETGIAASIAPVVYIPLADMASTGLSKTGSRIRYEFYYKFKPSVDVEKLVEKLDTPFDKADLRYETVEMRKRNTGRFFNDLTRFMSLVGFLALLLGCIGVASAVQIYIREKTPTIAVMRCLGVTVRRAFMIYLVQVAGIGLIGAVIGSLIGMGVQELLPRVMKDILPFTISTALSWRAIGQGIAIGLLMALVFGLLPLLSIRRITPLYTLRSSYEEGRRVRDPLRWPVYALVLVFIAGFAYLQLREIQPTLFFTLGLLLSFGLLTLTARILMIVLRRITRSSWSFSVRQGFANLYRPNNQTIVLVVSIGLSTALVCTLLFVQQMIVHQLVLAGSKSQANMIVFDIQTAQESALDSLTRAQGLPVLEKVPVVTVRFASIRGVRAGDTANHFGDKSISQNLNHEIRVTYRNALTPTETVVQGKWVGVAGQPIAVSFEEPYAGYLHLRVGDSVVFNVQGVEIPAIVGSLRKLQYDRMATNFGVVFPTGVLEQAPQFHVLLTRTSTTEVAVRYQQAVVRRFPTVSVINLALILSVLDEIIDKINYVIHFMAGFSMITGLIVLIASVRNSKYQRIQESVLLRTLGAGRKIVFRINALEYLFLGFLSGLTGVVIATAAAWLQGKFLLQLPFAVNFWPALGLLALVALLTMAIGLFNSRGVLQRSTLEVLRNEV